MAPVLKVLGSKFSSFSSTLRLRLCAKSIPRQTLPLIGKMVLPVLTYGGHGYRVRFSRHFCGS
jgi:hypothetical protein